MTTFTIVIAIRNAAAELRATLDSLDAQTTRDFEVIIADCNSTDAPASLLRDRPYPVQHVVQSDTGIYDSWNKVLPRARGEWVIFMGAGDQFATERTLAEAAAHLAALPPETLIAYGKIDAIGENGVVLRSTGTPWPQQLREIAAFDMYPHQATFQRRRSFEEHGYFDPDFAIAADVEMLLRLSRITPPVFFDQKIAYFMLGGVSSKPQSKLRANAERERILRLYGVTPRNRAINLFKGQLLTWLNRYVPQKVLHVIIDLYRQVTGRKPRFR